MIRSGSATARGSRLVAGAGVTASQLAVRRVLVGLAAVVAVAVVVGCGLLARYPLGELRYTSGLHGTPGEYTASSCVYGQFRDKGPIHCTGDFVPSGGGAVDHGAVYHDELGSVGVGKSVAFVRTPTRSYLPVGFGPAGADLGGGLLLLLFGAAVPAGWVAVWSGMLTALPLKRRNRLARRVGGLGFVVGVAAAAAYVLV